MILFCHFLEKYTFKILNESIDDDGFNVAICRDGLEDEYLAVRPRGSRTRLDRKILDRSEIRSTARLYHR